MLDNQEFAYIDTILYFDIELQLSKSAFCFFFVILYLSVLSELLLSVFLLLFGQLDPDF